jgi:hypothetical protein
MISTSANEKGCVYIGWTQLGPKILLHNSFCSGSAAKEHLEILSPLLTRLRRDGHVALKHLAVYGDAAELLKVKHIATLMAKEGEHPATVTFVAESPALFQRPEEIHGPPTIMAPSTETDVSNLMESMPGIGVHFHEIDEGLHRKDANREIAEDKDSEVKVTTYFEVLNWETARPRLAKIIERATLENACKYQSWTRSEDLLIVREAFDTASDVAAHWAYCGPMYAAMFATHAACLNRIEVHSPGAAAVEDAAHQLTELLNFARFDRLESETVGAVFARRVEPENVAAHRLLLFRLASATNEDNRLESVDDTHPRSKLDPITTPMPSPSWATRGHRVYLGRIAPMDDIL